MFRLKFWGEGKALVKASQEQQFVFSDGYSAADLVSLYKHIYNSDPAIFKYHIDNGTTHFVPWIATVCKDKKLAKILMHEVERVVFLNKMRAHLKSEYGIKKP